MVYRSTQRNNSNNFKQFSNEWQSRLKQWGYRNSGKLQAVVYSKYLLRSNWGADLDEGEQIIADYQKKAIAILARKFIEFGEIRSYVYSCIRTTDYLLDQEILSVQFSGWYEVKWNELPMTRESFFDGVEVDDAEISNTMTVQGMQSEVNQLIKDKTQAETNMFAALRDKAMKEDELDTVKEEMTIANSNIDKLMEQLAERNKMIEALQSRLQKQPSKPSIKYAEPEQAEEVQHSSNEITTREEFEEAIEEILVSQNASEIPMHKLVLKTKDRMGKGAFLPLITKLNESSIRFKAANSIVSRLDSQEAGGDIDVDKFVEVGTQAIGQSTTGKLQWGKFVMKLQDNYDPSIKWDAVVDTTKSLTSHFYVNRGFVFLANQQTV